MAPCDYLGLRRSKSALISLLNSIEHPYHWCSSFTVRWFYWRCQQTSICLMSSTNSRRSGDQKDWEKWENWTRSLSTTSCCKKSADSRKSSPLSELLWQTWLMQLMAPSLWPQTLSNPSTRPMISESPGSSNMTQLEQKSRGLLHHLVAGSKDFWIDTTNLATGYLETDLHPSG